MERNKNKNMILLKLYKICQILIMIRLDFVLVYRIRDTLISNEVINFGIKVLL
jgi:hypothetical protein